MGSIRSLPDGGLERGAAARRRPRSVVAAVVALAATLALAGAGSASAAKPTLIAFEHNDDIWAVHSDGTAGHDLTRTPGIVESAPAWSPDGTSIAYLRNHDIWEMNANGGGQHLVVADHGYGDDPGVDRAGVAWSATGQLAFTRFDASTTNNDLAVANADGSEQHFVGLQPNVRTGENRSPDIFGLTWTHDGTQLLFSLGNISNMNGLFLVNPDGTGLRHVLGTGSSDFDPRLSPDGSRLAFTRQWTLPGGDYAENLWLARSNGSHGHWLTHTHNDDFFPSWSPDGKSIVFARQRPTTVRHQTPFRLYTIDIARGTVHRLTTLSNSAPVRPAWQP